MQRTATVDALARFAHAFKERAWLALPLAAGNLLAVWWGYTIYYDDQLARTAWYLKPFVPDSPNAVGAFALALLLYQAGRRRHALLDLVAFAWNVKVGLWTMFILLHHYEYFFGQNPRPGHQWFLFWLHLGMVLQAFVLVRDLDRTRPPAWAFVALAALLLGGDALDYGLGIHPHFDPRRDPTDVALVTFALSAASGLLAWLLFRPRRR